MKKLGWPIAAMAILVSTALAYAADMSGIIKAQMVLGQIDQVVDKYKEVQALLDSGEIELDVPEPRYDSEGEFVFPYKDDGYLAEWAEKAISAQAGGEVGALAGDKAAGALASKVPFGGLAGGLIKSKSKEIGAVTAVGGWDFIRETSDLSFDKLDEYSVYMHAEFQGLPDYEQALAAAMAIYPQLERSHQRAVDKAYRDARKAAKDREKN